MVHPDLDNQGGQIPDDPDVIKLYEAKGWVKQDQIPVDLDPEAINTGETAQPVPKDDSDGINTGETALPIVRVTDDQVLVTEDDQEKPKPRKSIKKSAPSGDNTEEGVDL